MTLIVACGLKREARIFVDPERDIVAVVGGGCAATLERALEGMVTDRTSLILSCGIAGGLSPTLRPGAVVIDGDAAIVERLQRALPQARCGGIVGQDAIAATAAEKSGLHARTAALAVDMESHVVRRVAERRRLPCAMLRVIADRAQDDLPPAALVGMRPDGGVALRAVFGSLARHPRQLPALLRTAHQADRAFRSLARAFDAVRRAGIDR